MIDFMNIGENISDEMLSAYIDGNTTPEENSMIQNALENDELLTEAIDIVNDSSTFGSGDWEALFGSHGDSELALSSIAELDNQSSFGIEGHTLGGDNLFGSSFDFGLAATDPTDSEEECHTENDDSNLVDGSDSCENTDEYSNMDNLNY